MQNACENSSQYSDATHNVSSFSTVQGFWKLWNHTPKPSELLEQKKRIVREQPDGLHIIDAIMIFRDGGKPEREDKLNANSGHFQFQLTPNVRVGQWTYWLEREHFLEELVSAAKRSRAASA